MREIRLEDHVTEEIDACRDAGAEHGDAVRADDAEGVRLIDLRVPAIRRRARHSLAALL